MKLIHMLRKCPHISTKTVIYGEMLTLSLLYLNTFLYKVDSGQTVMSQAARLTGTVNPLEGTNGPGQERQEEKRKEHIKWVNFAITSEAVNQAFRYDTDTCQAEIHLNWVDLLVYLDARYGGDFSKYKPEHMGAVAERLKTGEITMADLAEDMKYYTYYRDACGMMLDGMVDQFQAETLASEAPAAYFPSNMVGGASGDPATVWMTKYESKILSPTVKGFPYNDPDDFGVVRNYGFKRRHLDHNMVGQMGTPVIAVESGYVEAIGWSQYGGWRLDIRSSGHRRYYCYAHLRKSYPYQPGLKEGSVVQAGDVAGYLGRTGYSRTGDTNNINESYPHLGLKLVFDESRKESSNEIWVSCYELAKLPDMNRRETVKVEGTKEWKRIYQTKDPIIPATPSEVAPPAPSAPPQE